MDMTVLARLIAECDVECGHLYRDEDAEIFRAPVDAGADDDEVDIIYPEDMGLWS